MTPCCFMLEPPQGGGAGQEQGRPLTFLQLENLLLFLENCSHAFLQTLFLLIYYGCQVSSLGEKNHDERRLVAVTPSPPRILSFSTPQASRKSFPQVYSLEHAPSSPLLLESCTHQFSLAGALQMGTRPYCLSGLHWAT